MSPAELAYWGRLQLLAGRFSPSIATAILRAFAVIRASFTDEQLAAVVASGNVERVLAQALSASLMDSAFLPARERIRSSVGQSIAYFAREIPKPPPTAPPGASVTFGFDILNPRVIDAIRTVESKVITNLESDVREVVRAVVETGLRDGASSAAIGRNLRAVVGLSPSQEQAVQNFRSALSGEPGAKTPLLYKLRDRRFDRTLAKNGELTAAQIERMTVAYRERMVAFNAETVARTAAGDAMKLGQHLSVMDAIDKGIYDPNRLVKTWIGVMDSRERPEHVAMEKQVVPFDMPYSNGEFIPGESTYNCRCISRYSQRKV